MALSFLLAVTLLAADPMLKPGDHTRTLKVDGRDRSYLVHVPKKYDGKKPMPVVRGHRAVIAVDLNRRCWTYYGSGPRSRAFQIEFGLTAARIVWASNAGRFRLGLNDGP